MWAIAERGAELEALSESEWRKCSVLDRAGDDADAPRPDAAKAVVGGPSGAAPRQT